MRLDVTDPEQIAAAADRCGDVDLLINNAGVFHRSPLLGAPSIQDVREEMETNLFGTLAVTRAFAPVLGRNGGGAVVNTLSVLSFINYAPWGTYSVSKAAAWSMANSVRDELAAQGTLVTAVHSALVDTGMTAGLDFPKITPRRVCGRGPGRRRGRADRGDRRRAHPHLQGDARPPSPPAAAELRTAPQP